MSLKAVLCREGRDTGLRLMAILLAAFLLLTVTAIVFSASVINWIVMLAVMPIVGLSAIRRLNDANKPIKLAMICVVPVLIFGILIYFMMPVGILAGVFLFGLACGGYFAFLPAKNSIRYVQGYNGPSIVQSSIFGSVHQRQEPVMKGQIPPVNSESEHSFTSPVLSDNEAVLTDSAVPHSAEVDKHQFKDDLQQLTIIDQDDVHIAHSADSAVESDQSASFTTSSSRSHQPLYVDQNALQSGSITELTKTWLNMAKLHRLKLILIGKIAVAILAVCLVVYLVFALVSAFSDNEAKQSQPTEDTINEQQTSLRQTIKLPDGFWLALDNNILIVRWLGDSGDEHKLWDLATAKGDKTCSHLEFNDGSSYRPITVDLLQDSATEARFTPLDKNAIVNNVALRGSFKLCGYEFSLKGSQATLMQNPQFEMILSQ
ncbi:DUF805 domain-containing protein [Shewanella polaris]|uniref:DUF805 domain-containing protein n=1 Tax=Shewanella polaris TaxID=2588449 RepID=A0A4Y5YB52_9GAMM|nr:DUF805 domain-containing protein [Shewanella polaris]QDE29788.1 DUF805 domain-containing protein [Shewanella polaris]